MTVPLTANLYFMYFKLVSWCTQQYRVFDFTLGYLCNCSSAMVLQD